jgi:HSP20 family protein
MADSVLFRPWAGAGGGFDELRREMDALMNRFGQSGPAGARGVFPAANLYDTGEGYVLTAELPGVSPDDVQVLLEGATLVLRGERRTDHPDDQAASAHRLERQFGSFRRAFELPAAIDPNGAEAVHKNGVLMLRLPKAPEHRRRQISVQAG